MKRCRSGPQHGFAWVALVHACALLAGCQAGGGPSAATPMEGGQGMFRDVAPDMGIRFTVNHGDTVRYEFLQAIGGGCAFLDFDQDGWLDVFVVSPGNFPPDGKHPNLKLFRNLGGKAFEDATPGSGLEAAKGYFQAASAADYDNDGRPDLFVPGYGGCLLFRNETKKGEAKARFRDVTAVAGVGDRDAGPRWASGAAWADYDRDGLLDLYVCHYALWTPETNKECPHTDGSPGHCVPTVYDGDPDRLYRNLGGGRFRDVSKEAGISRIASRGLAVAWIDCDDDGDPDVYVANDLHPNLLFRNEGDGTFTEIGELAGVALGAGGLAASGMGIALGDLDQEGSESLLVTNLHGEGYSLFRRTGPGMFRYASRESGLHHATVVHSGWGAAFADFDRDGLPDLVTADGSVHEAMTADLYGISYKEPKGLYRNLGKGRFGDWGEARGGLSLPLAARGLATGDFDNDGRIDVLCVNRNGPVQLLRNESRDSNGWLQLTLVGTKSSRSPAGAAVTLTAPGYRQRAMFRLGSSYASSSDPRLHFGLGAIRGPFEAQVRWPSGRRQMFSSLAPNRDHTLREEP